MTDKRIPIILCAGQSGRAVLFGYVDAEPEPSKPVMLHDARMVLYWAPECGGLLGLAARGPAGETRITPSVPRTVETAWQEWVQCTSTGAEAINDWPAC